MSSMVKWGGIAGLVAAALLIVSAVLNQMSPVQQTYDSAVSYLYLGVAARCLHRSNRCLAWRFMACTPERLDTAGWAPSDVVLTIAGYAIIAVADSDQHGARTGITPHGSPCPAQCVLLIGSALLGVIIIRARLLPWWCGVLLIVAFPLGDQANAIFSSAENLLLALLWGSMGVALLSRRQKVGEPVATQGVTS